MSTELRLEERPGSGPELRLVRGSEVLKMFGEGRLKARPLARSSYGLAHSLPMRVDVALNTVWTAVETPEGELILADGTKRLDTLLKAATSPKRARREVLMREMERREVKMLIYRGERVMALRLARDMNAIPIPTRWERAEDLERIRRYAEFLSIWIKYPKKVAVLFHVLKAAYWVLSKGPVLGIRRNYKEISEAFDRASDEEWRAMLKELAALIPRIATGAVELDARRRKI
ncbi:MAG: hypothetical protein RXR01_02435 [Thermoproteus sp.]